MHAEVWDPMTQNWRTDALLSNPRTYHSSSVLLPDGRVFVGGGGLCGNCGVNHPDAEIYSPNYLFNANGSPATRPTITLSKTSVGVLPSHLHSRCIGSVICPSIRPHTQRSVFQAAGVHHSSFHSGEHGLQQQLIRIR